MHRECLMLIAQAYVAWVFAHNQLVPPMPHLLRRCVAEYYAAMEGRPHYANVQ